MGKQVGIRPIAAQEMREYAVATHVNVPIEQTWVWAEFEETFPDRNLMGFFGVTVDGETVAILGLTRYDYHGFEFVWAKHGPVWLVENTQELEDAALTALVSWLKKKRARTAFVRLHLEFPHADARPPLQITTYDRTVYVALAPDEATLMSGYKPRMRTNIRGAAKKSPLEFADETERAAADMSEYYAVMQETADRQGFTPWSKDVYQSLLETLGEEHARLYTARSDGELVAFTIITLAGVEAIYYYAAATDLGRKTGASAQLLHYACKTLGEEGLTRMDLMGVGSPLAPSLDVLTTFKSGFAKEIAEVAPAYDVPVNKTLFKTLELLGSGKSKVNTLKEKLSRSEKDD